MLRPLLLSLPRSLEANLFFGSKSLTKQDLLQSLVFMLSFVYLLQFPFAHRFHLQLSHTLASCTCALCVVVAVVVACSVACCHWMLNSYKYTCISCIYRLSCANWKWKMLNGRLHFKLYKEFQKSTRKSIPSPDIQTYLRGALMSVFGIRSMYVAAR